MNILFSCIKSIQEFLWGLPMLVILAGTHLYFTFHLRFIQKKIPKGICLSFSKEGQGTGSLSPFSALATALAATIGTGNIIGISTAVAIGGPGAVFWCWITGLLGIATCYAECFLSVKYRVKNADGSFSGGPMYVMEHALHQKSAAAVFAVSVVLASFGMGSSVQSRSICAAVTEQAAIPPELIGAAAAVLAGLVILGGAKQVAKVCTWLVPFMSAFFLGGCLLLIWMNRRVLPETVLLIVSSAAAPRSVAGGAAGSAMLLGIRVGISRGLFTNEAGLGSIPMAAASSGMSVPEKQAMVSMTGPFWDTVIMCAVTGIAIVSCMVKAPELFIGAEEERLCFLAFSRLPLNGSLMLSVSLVLFAFATIIGWNYYGECAVRYLGKGRGLKEYRIFYVLAVYIGAVVSLDQVWILSDLFNSLMAIPNILCIWMLRDEVSPGKK